MRRMTSSARQTPSTIAAARFVDQERLWSRLMELARCGATATGGVNRVALSSAEVEARSLLAKWCDELRLETFVDDVGNFFMRRSGIDNSLAPVLTGSHIDTQPSGGRFDGAYGVVAGIEALHALATGNIRTRRPIEVVVWNNEEGCRFVPGMTGSACFIGERALSTALQTADRDGITMAQALAPIFAATPTAGRRRLGIDVAAFVEAHIEQGPVLEAARCKIGVVTRMQGRRSFRIAVRGEAAHAGTTPHRTRRDALSAAVAMIHALEGIMVDSEDQLRFTVGQFEVAPNSPGVVPDRVLFSIDLRHPDDEVMQDLGDRIDGICHANARRCSVTVTELTSSRSVTFAKEVSDLVEAAAIRLRIPRINIHSNAGHDSRQLAKVCPTGMIFIPCKGGISHNEAESSTPEDAFAGAQVLSEVLVDLANRELT